MKLTPSMMNITITTLCISTVSVLGTVGSDLLGANTNVTLGTLALVLSIVVPGAFYFGVKLQTILNELKNLNNQQKDLDKKIQTLPCQSARNVVCLDDGK